MLGMVHIGSFERNRGRRICWPCHRHSHKCASMATLTCPIQPHELDPKMRDGFSDLVRRVTAKAAIEGRGRDLLLRVYLAGLYHGAELVPSPQPDPEAR